MREILFRGKGTHGFAKGKWVYGYYLKDFWGENRKGFGIHLIEGGYSEVDPETVGQYTGLIDKNGKKIFEGDIVKGRHWTSLNKKNPEEYHLWLVDWNEKSGLIVFLNSPTSRARLSIHDFADLEEIEVIGNTHDNPELLKKGGETDV